MRRALLALPLLAAAPSEPVVISPAPAAVAVTVYRNPYTSDGGRLDLRYLAGFALVTETRTIRLPAGPATLRFEGVADGIVPVSAIVAGLPGGVIEKNRDARLLSPASLVDGYLGRRVTLTHTDRKSGKIRVEEAVIVAGPAGGVVVRTPEGVEALGCAGLGDKPRYPAVPAGLSAGPVLSVETVSPHAATATVTLSYLASEFDWSASYVATLRPDGRSLDLFAWLTLANGNAQAFPAAQVQVVAGRLNRRDQRYRVVVAPLRLDCYPLGTTTSDLRERTRETEDIVVTGSRVVMPAAIMASPPPPPPPPPPPEDLGDLKLYRVPERVTVAANAQKQVALLARARVPFTRVYRRTLAPGRPLGSTPTAIALRLVNRADAGLGLPLPAGSTTLYGRRGTERLLLGTGRLADKAVGETLRIGAGTSEQVRVAQTRSADKQARVELSNANPFAVTAEIALDLPPGNVVSNAAIATLDGRPTWTVVVPANGRRTLDYATR